MGELADRGHWLEQPKEIGLRRDYAGHRSVGLGKHPLEGVEVRGSGGVAIHHQGNFVELQAAAEIGAQRLAILRMDAAGDEHPLASGRPASHQRGLGRGGGAVVVGCRDHVQADELGQQRFVLVDALQGSLADLGLVRRIGRIPLAAQKDLVDRGRAPVAIHARSEERRQVGAVAARQGHETRGQLELGLGFREVQAGSPQRDRDVVEELVDRREAEGLEHLRPIGRRVRTVWHREVQPAAISSS